MPTWDSFAKFANELKGFEGDLTDTEVRKITRQMGREGQDIAARKAAGDLGGDRAFSGWTRANPIQLDTLLRNGADGATIITPTRSSAGPWTVAQYGRNAAAGPRLIGPRLTRTGRVSKARQRRYNGRTRGKGTATDATTEMERKLPPIADKAILKATRKRFDVT